MSKIASFEEGEALSFFIFPIQMKAENINEKHARILSKLIKHLLKMGSKIYSKMLSQRVLGGYLERLGALPRGHVASGSIVHRCGAPVWDLFGAMLAQNR